MEENKAQEIQVEEVITEPVDKPSKAQKIFKIVVYAFLTIVLVLVAAALANA